MSVSHTTSSLSGSGNARPSLPGMANAHSDYPPVAQVAQDTPPPFAAPTPVRAGSPKMSSESIKDAAAGVAVREISRTPSPTPSEAVVLKEKVRICNWQAIFHWRRYANKRGICTCRRFRLVWQARTECGRMSLTQSLDSHLTRDASYRRFRDCLLGRAKGDREGPRTVRALDARVSLRLHSRVTMSMVDR